jgi:hypothetical protein
MKVRCEHLALLSRPGVRVLRELYPLTDLSLLSQRIRTSNKDYQSLRSLFIISKLGYSSEVVYESYIGLSGTVSLSSSAISFTIAGKPSVSLLTMRPK